MRSFRIARSRYYITYASAIRSGDHGTVIYLVRDEIFRHGTAVDLPSQSYERRADLGNPNFPYDDDLCK